MITRRLLAAPIILGVLLMLLFAACSDATSEVGDTEPTATAPTTTEPTTETTVHLHDAAEVREWDGLGPAEVNLQVTGDAASGWEVVIDVPQFTFTLAEEHVPGEGHGHLMVDGQLQTMIVEPIGIIAELSPGIHEIAVMLSANDHIDYVIGEDRWAAP